MTQVKPKYTLEAIALNGVRHPVGYRVVTPDMRSLGLRRNPNILTYPVGEWLELPEEQVKPGKGDWGGIWVARTLSNARRLSQYMMEHYSQDTRVFKCAIGRVLYSNSYRVKTDAVILLEEIL